MKVLVTGAPGWLGDSLVEELIKKKFEVRCLCLEGFDTSKLEKLGAKIVRGDITQKKSLSGVCKGIKIVFHCAGIIHPKRVRDLYEINYYGTVNLINEAIFAGVQKFVYVSSNSPAGINIDRNVLLKESDEYNPYKTYGESKMLSEIYVNKMFRQGKIDTAIVRPCWFYGPNQPLRQTTFFNMIKKGNPFVFGDGNNLRSMCYIDNVIQGLILAATESASSGQTYWIADEKPYSTMEIYETIANILGVKLKPRYLPNIVSTLCEAADGVLQTIGFYNKEIHVAGEMNKDIACSIEKAKKELGYKPKISLKEGMKRSIEWCRKQGVDI
jgi:nucleoside-diphosphate-sugar epimerase